MVFRIIHTVTILGMASLFFWGAGTLLDWQWEPLPLGDEAPHPVLRAGVDLLMSIFGQRSIEWFTGTYAYFAAPIGGVIVGDWLVRKVSDRGDNA